ncbi:TMV resistance protein N-like [Trifolium pratense]|uniref:TMV resistance protein N-like n=1 Tax=Trifolium pratense TaxID=57577 RepID=A0A2K3NCM7_TRIPR|nr:TMV resistance protein N-like [Trifolium pratense]
MAYTFIDDEASSSSSSSCWSNHVFLSFRGEDTRRGFTDHLFASLERKGIKTFKDDYDLKKGEKISNELNKAIEESMFAIIILSPNYASSTWCLDELQKIVECNKSFGQAVFPIFYGVDPSDVRNQRGSFDEAFRKHEEKFRNDRMKVERWRGALREVASYSGWDSKDRIAANHDIMHIRAQFGQAQQPIRWADRPRKDQAHLNKSRVLLATRLHVPNLKEVRIDSIARSNTRSPLGGTAMHEASLVDTVVEHIQKKLIPRLKVKDNLVGMDSRIKEVYSLLGMGLNDVRFIGIWGMGGIGKTTVARELFETIKDKFKPGSKNGLVQEVE